MQSGAIHHVALTVTDLDRSKAFYREVLSLNEIQRPPFDFPGAWFELGSGQHVHLIVHSRATFRNKPLDARDVHFAVRVADYEAAVESLRAKGYREQADRSDPLCMIVSRHPVAGFPQIYICDPDGHVIEINAERLSGL